MPHSEWVMWHAYFAAEAQERELAQKGNGGG